MNFPDFYCRCSTAESIAASSISNSTERSVQSTTDATGRRNTPANPY